MTTNPRVRDAQELHGLEMTINPRVRDARELHGLEMTMNFAYATRKLHNPRPILI